MKFSDYPIIFPDFLLARLSEWNRRHEYVFDVSSIPHLSLTEHRQTRLHCSPGETALFDARLSRQRQGAPKKVFARTYPP